MKSTILCAILTLSLPVFGQDNGLLPKHPVPATSLMPAERQILPMPLAERIKRGIVPQRGLCSTIPGGLRNGNDLLMSGNGTLFIKVSGNPLSELVIFRHERVFAPYVDLTEAPRIAHVLPDVRKLMLEGKFDQGAKLSLDAAAKAGMPPGVYYHGLSTPFVMKIEQPAAGPVHNYLRTLDFESGETRVLWEDPDGQWERRAFVSRPDNLAVQWLTAPEGRLVNTRISLDTAFDRDSRGITHKRDFNSNRMIVEGHFDPKTGNSGYAGVVRVVLNGGKASIENGALVVEGAKSLLLLTRIEWFKDFHNDKVTGLVDGLEKITLDYPQLLARNREAQSAVFGRASLNFEAGPDEQAMSGEELIADQLAHIGYNRTLLNKLFDMGRYWLMLESGDFPSIFGHLNINVNLQVAGGEMANLPEAMNAYYNWIEGLLPDSRNNAKNIFGTRGALVSVHPDQQEGVLFHYDYFWPHHYWISGGGWSYSPFWDHYLITGDKDFLRQRVMPGLRELALFYEDYLAVTGADGNFIFVPSYSPENWPSNSPDKSRVAINATMDIMVCREVLTHLIQGAEILGTDAASIPKWRGMLAKMPNYLLDPDGSLKEWAWPASTENQDHRHVSHLYGVWPADEIDPDRTPQLAKAAWLANRKRAQENASGHGLSHRALAAARLKDSYLVNFELKQLLEMGYFSNALTSAHNPYIDGFAPDQQGSVLALLMEMLVYSRDGVMELLPALPDTLGRGNIKGILARTYAKVDDMTWDLEARTIDLTLTSLRDQDVSLIVRYGIDSITAPDAVLGSQPAKGADRCVIHLPKGKPVTLHVRTGGNKPSDWITRAAHK